MIAVIESRLAQHDDGECPACRQLLERGQRIVLVRDQAGHRWLHIRHVLGGQRSADAVEDQADKQPPAAASAEGATCEACSQPMTIITAGQRHHPMCEPTDVASQE